MSVYASLDGGEPTQVASNLGWSEFCDWVDGLDVDGADAVVHLREYAWSDDLAAMYSQLTDSLKADKPDADVESVATTILDMIDDTADDGVLTINDGMVNEGGEEDADEPDSVTELDEPSEVEKPAGNEFEAKLEGKSFVGSQVTVKAGRFDESKHPRADNGKFGHGGSGITDPEVKEAVDAWREVFPKFRKGGVPKAEIDNVIEKLEELGRSQLLEAAKAMNADATLTPKTPRAKILKQVTEMVMRVWKTSDNVRH